MKTFKPIIFPVFILTMLIYTGCAKSFLDHPLENNPPVTNIDYTDLSLMYQPVSGVYKIAATGGFAEWVGTFMKTSQSDDIDPNTGYPEVNDLVHTFKNTAVQSFWAVNELWNNYYRVIINANNALAELDKFGKNVSPGDAANNGVLSRCRAEVRFFRALGNYYLARSYGDVPILGEESINPGYLDTVRKSKVADVRMYIMSEMDDCIANLEDLRPNEVPSPRIGAVTKYTALMLKAKAAMDLAGNDNASPYWDIVLDATNQIISSHKFSLFSDYYQLWKKPGKLSNEAILEFQYSDFGGVTDIRTSGPDVWNNLFLFQGPPNTYGGPISGSGWLVPSDNAFNFLMARNDAIRIKTVFEKCGINGDVKTYAVTPAGDTVSGNDGRKKYFNGKAYFPKSQMTPGQGWYGGNNNIHFWRYADVLLMNAEARMRKGQNGDAPLNEVRMRVGLLPLTNATIDQLLDERRAEFICEWWGERLNDLIRTDRAASVLPSFVKGQGEFLPVPQGQIDINSNLK